MSIFVQIGDWLDGGKAKARREARRAVLSNLASYCPLSLAWAEGDKRFPHHFHRSVDDLLALGDNLNFHLAGQTTPLQNAALGSCSEIVSYLLGKGADPNFWPDDREARLFNGPPLFQAVKGLGWGWLGDGWFEDKHADTVRRYYCDLVGKIVLLLDAGAKERIEPPFAAGLGHALYEAKWRAENPTVGTNSQVAAGMTLVASIRDKTKARAPHLAAVAEAEAILKNRLGISPFQPPAQA